MRIDVFTIFPDLVEHYCARQLLGRARQRGVLDLRVHDLRDGAGGSRPVGRRRPLRRRGRGWSSCPSPCFAPCESIERAQGLPRPLFLLSPGGRRLDQARGRGAGGRARRGVSRCCAGATRGWTSGSPTTWSTGSSRSATSSWPGASWPPWWWWRPSARLLPGVAGQRGVGRATRASPGPARVPPVHPAGGVPGLGGARGPPLGRPRPHRPLAPGAGAASDPARRPTSSRRGRADRRGRLLASAARPPRHEERAVVGAGSRLHVACWQALHGRPPPRSRRCPSRSDDL